MKYTTLTTTIISLLTSSIHASSPGWSNYPPCLTDTEANTIATNWLHIWGTNAVSSLSDLTGILSPDIASYDDTFGDPTFGVEAILDEVTAPGNSTTTDVKQFPLFVIHSCDQIAVRWEYTGITTGYGSTVPVGTHVSFTGNDILQVDLDTRLIYNASSSGEWILLARQLGETCDL